MRIVAGVVMFMGLAGARLLMAENWPHWRGPFLNGSTTEAHLPDKWGPDENVAWVTKMPGRSAATPIIWGDSVFVSSSNPANELLLLCVDAKDGRVRWQKKVGSGDKYYSKNNMASPSPVTDGKIVVVMFGTGDLAAFDMDGRELWSRNLAAESGKFALMFYYSSSPLLYRGKLYVQVLQRNVGKTYTHSTDDKPNRDSFLQCIDPQTGKDIWRQVRKCDAVGETMEAYTSPMPWESEKGAEILVLGGGCITSHRADTGQEIWRTPWLYPNHGPLQRTITSPVIGPGLVYVCCPRGKNPVLGIKLGGTGQLPDSQIVWRYTEHASDVPAPLYYQDKLFLLDGNKRFIVCLDPKTGQKKWEGTLDVEGVLSASPTGADGKIYCISEAGAVVVLSAGDEFKVISSFAMTGEGGAAPMGKNGIPVISEGGSSPMLSSIAAANGHLFIRTAQNLYCIGARHLK